MGSSREEVAVGVQVTTVTLIGGLALLTPSHCEAIAAEDNTTASDNERSVHSHGGGSTSNRLGRRPRLPS